MSSGGQPLFLRGCQTRMFEKFTDKARKVMSLAQEEARSLGKMYVGTEHLLLALIKEGEGIAAQALAKLDVTYEETIATVREISSEVTEPVPGGHIPFTPRAKRVLEDAYRETMTHGQTYIATEHLLLGIVAEGDGRAMTALSRMGVSGDAVRNAVSDLIATNSDNPRRERPMAAEGVFDPRTMGAVPGGQTSDDDSMLESYGKNLTRMATDDKLDPVIGRDREVERVMQVLARRQKNNPLILGDPGVGKTAVVEGLAQLVASGNVPDILGRRRRHPLHRRDPHHHRRRLRRGLHRRRLHPQAAPVARRDPGDRRHHLRRVPQAHREGLRLRASLPARLHRRAEHLRHHRHSPWPAGPL